MRLQGWGAHPDAAVVAAGAEHSRLDAEAQAAHFRPLRGRRHVAACLWRRGSRRRAVRAPARDEAGLTAVRTGGGTHVPDGERPIKAARDQIFHVPLRAAQGT